MKQPFPVDTVTGRHRVRTALLALLLSLVAHAVVLASVLGIAAWRGLSFTAPLRLQTVSVDVVKTLPLGPHQPAGPPAAGEEPPLPVRRKAPRVRVAHDGVTVPSAADAGAPGSQDARRPSDDAGVAREAGTGHRRPGDLHSYGPEGSRLTALLRLDRLRASPAHAEYIAAIDQLLVLLPDRHRLLDGTGLDLYRDFDALLIATPNPADDAVTFLAARHHLRERELKAALDRGAAAGGHTIAWRDQEGRPLGIRQPPKATPGQVAVLDRDDRIFALPQPSLAVMAPPAYAQHLLGQQARNQSPHADGGADNQHRSTGESRPDWSDLVARIDAEDGALPEDAVFMMTAANLLVPAPAASSLVVPGTRGAVDDPPPRPVSPYGPMPQVFTLVASIEPAPTLEIIGEFERDADARAWEQGLPSLKRKILSNPILLLAGFSALVDRAEITRDGRTVDVHLSITLEELRRVLGLASTLTRAAAAQRR